LDLHPYHKQRDAPSAYNLAEMSRPFESFEFPNRGWDVRVLEGQSLRSLFVIVLVDLFMLGIITFMMIYEVVRLHRFNWQHPILFLIFIMPAFRYSRLIYRRLGR
jgi:hypothetical protein